MPEKAQNQSEKNVPLRYPENERISLVCSTSLTD